MVFVVDHLIETPSYGMEVVLKLILRCQMIESNEYVFIFELPWSKKPYSGFNSTCKILSMDALFWTLAFFISEGYNKAII